MEKIEWAAGNEKRFAEFVSKLDKKDKIALLSHNDLDGIASAKIVYEVVKPDLLMFVGYEELDDNLITKLKKNKINKIIMCDLYLNEMRKSFIENIQKLGDILLVDHHPFFHDVKKLDRFLEHPKVPKQTQGLFDFNSEKMIFLNADGYCAAYLCYVLFSKIKNLESYDWLVACACLADFCYKKNLRWMEETFEKYGEKFRGGVAEGIHEGRIVKLMKKITRVLVYFRGDMKKVFDILDDKMESVNGLNKYAEEVQKEIDNCIERFEKEKEKIKGGYFWEFAKNEFGIKSLVANAISLKYFDKTILILEEDGNLCRISGRRQDRGEDMNKLLKKLVEGFENAFAGGHISASGGHFFSKDKEKFIKRVKNL